MSDFAIPYASPASPPLRLLPPPSEIEVSRAHRLAGMTLALLLSAGYLLFILQYWSPAHSGVDQNGYLVGGRMLAQTGSTGYTPPHELGFVGAMWVRNDETGVNYPKYPIGLSLLYALSLRLFGGAPGGLGVQAAFLVSPIGAALGVLGMYFLARQFAGVFGSLCAMLLLAFSQLTLSLANNPNSHASCLACVVWGAFLLLRFWQTGSIWRGGLGGFLLGYAVTIRYTEGLLGLLIGVAILAMIDYRHHLRDWRLVLRVFVPVLGWLIPVGYLVLFNLVAMGTPTGYDTTNESKPGSAFTLEHITQNWEKLIRQVHDTGMFFSLPLALLGMLLAFRVSARRALILWLWLIPGALLYMSYYWAPDRGVSYLRFFLTLLPPLAVGVGVTIDQVQRLATDRMQRIFLPIGGGLVVTFACALGLYRGLFGLEDGQETGSGLEGQYRQMSNLAEVGRMVTREAPAGSVLWSGASQLHYLQFAGDYECFSTEYFTPNFVNRLRSMESRVDAETDPMTQQPARRRFLLSKLEGKDEKALSELQLEMIKQRLGEGRRVFLVLAKPAMDAAVKKLVRRETGLQSRIVARYDELGRVMVDPAEADLTPQQLQQRRANPAAAARRGRPAPGPAGRWREPVPQTWQVAELTLAPEPAAPATRPSLEERMRQRRAAEAAAQERAKVLATEEGDRSRAQRPVTRPTSRATTQPASRPTQAPATRRSPAPPRPAATTRPAATLVRIEVRPASRPSSRPATSPTAPMQPATRP